MGIFDPILNALGGKPAPAPNPGTGTKVKVTGDFSDDMEIKRRNDAARAAAMAASQNSNAVSGIDTAMSAHADKIHPVPKMRGSR
jgi:hypothetical protein